MSSPRFTIQDRNKMLRCMGAAPLLIEHGLSANDPVLKRGRSPLAQAIASNRFHVVEIFVEHEPQLVTAATRVGSKSSALHLACAYGHVETVRLLLAKGAVPTSDCLVDAARKCVNCTYVILRAGVNPNVTFQDKNNQQTNLLHECCQWGRADVMRLLLRHGANVNQINNVTQGKTCLHVAAETGQSQLVQVLLDCEDINVNANDANGWTPLHTALVSNESLQIPQLLLTNGANPRATTSNGMTAMHLFWHQGRHIDPDGGRATVEYLQSVGVPLEDPDAEGCTPLLLACCQAEPALVETFTALGADIHARDELGRTALHYACQRWDGRRVGNCLALCQVLLRLGANPILADTQGNLPFFTLAQEGQETLDVYGSIYCLFEAALHHGLFQNCSS